MQLTRHYDQRSILRHRLLNLKQIVSSADYLLRSPTLTQAEKEEIISLLPSYEHEMASIENSLYGNEYALQMAS